MRIERKERRYRLPRPPASVAGVLRESPALVPALGATVTFLALAASEAGFYPTAWYAAALFLLGLLIVTLIGLGLPRGLPRPALAALVLLGAYTAWAYLSITWADQQGDAWDGANRTALYMLVFALFVLWPMGEQGGRLVLGLLGLGIAGIGLVELLRADAAADPGGYFLDARLTEPAGYINANVALWTLGTLACLFSAGSRETPIALRPLCLAGAGLLAALALLGQSRGWALALPVALVVLVVLTPGRVRLLSAIGAVALGVLVIRGPLVAVHDDVGVGSLAGRLDDAAEATLLLTVALALVGLVWGLVDRRVQLSAGFSRGLGRALGVAAVLVVVGAGVAAAAGEPADRLGRLWDDFREGGGVQEGSSRFGSAGTNRYDFWKTAWELFEEEPVRGIGIDNFQVEYLRRGTSTELPRYPHSLELGVLSQTGLVGGLLLAGALVAAAIGAAGVRAAPRGRRAVAGAALGIAAYWLLHASVDWFWEFPALTGPGVAMLGMACALAPRPAAQRAPTGSRRPRLLAVPAGMAALALALSLLLPWFAELQIDRALDGWRDDPATAFDRLGSAEDLNPLSNEAQLTAATIALSLGETTRARTEFAKALERDAETAYALLELGLIAAEEGRRTRAEELLSRAVRLTPRDAVARQTLRAVQRGRDISAAEVNRRILRRVPGRSADRVSDGGR
jgi:O-antigen ligase